MRTSSRSLARRSLLAVSAAAMLALAGCSTTPAAPTDAGSGAPSDASASAEPTTPAGTCVYGAAGPAAKDAATPPAEPTASGTVPATIRTSAGDLAVSLDADAAPCTVNSFLSLAQQGYFDETPCHRLTTSGIFVLQCGDPTGTGTGGPGYEFPDELTGSETYPAGTLAMANAGPDTNGSQFFVVYADTQLAPSYTVFGSLDAASVEVVKAIAAKGTDTGAGDGKPKEPVTIAGVTAG
ncbi:peptidylprolyl isomerase [Microbacterium resistens]|uniref:peptidylprolyl isomerase n=1 Tax=Microbacterium resistens TaxID=156977 RepID=UPI001F2EA539|nr:peptidylprolyl isomerase [Microbacterium resistens]MBW1638716.1 peptidylprolyl isomerase [Microbacterium resistens]